MRSVRAKRAVSRRRGTTGVSPLSKGLIRPGFLFGCLIVGRPQPTRIGLRGPVRGWSGGDLEMLENSSNDDGIAEKGDHRNASSTPCTEERVDKEDPVEELGPAQRGAWDGRGGGLRGIGLDPPRLVYGTTRPFRESFLLAGWVAQWELFGVEARTV